MSVACAPAWLSAFHHTMERPSACMPTTLRSRTASSQQCIIDKRHLHTFSTNFANTDPAIGIHTFTATSYAGTAESETVQGRWKAQHAGDFMGFPAADKQTVARGMIL